MHLERLFNVTYPHKKPSRHRECKRVKYGHYDIVYPYRAVGWLALLCENPIIGYSLCLRALVFNTSVVTTTSYIVICTATTYSSNI